MLQKTYGQVVSSYYLGLQDGFLFAFKTVEPYEGKVNLLETDVRLIQLQPHLYHQPHRPSGEGEVNGVGVEVGMIRKGEVAGVQQ